MIKTQIWKTKFASKNKVSNFRRVSGSKNQIRVPIKFVSEAKAPEMRISKIRFASDFEFASRALVTQISKIRFASVMDSSQICVQS